MDFKQARKLLGYTQQEVLERLDIPIRTQQNWESGRAACPIYVEKLIVKEMMSLLKNRKKEIKNMTFTSVKFKRNLNINELRELLNLMEIQETTDKYTDVSMRIDGDYAVIEVEIDECGNITVL